MGVLLDELSKINNFVTKTNRTPYNSHLSYSPEEEEGIAEELNAFNEPMSYMEHTNWINFAKYDLPKPIYINLIRHPIQKVMSAYYYIRIPKVHAYYVKKYNRKVKKSEEYFNTTFSECVRQAKRPACIFNSKIKYNSDWRRAAVRFCGNKRVCTRFNSRTATQIAKRNIEQDYAVVGSWEDTNITLTVLEHYIPRFFRGATQIYYSGPNKFQVNTTPHSTELDPDVEAKLKKQFSFEIELYNYCKQRLYKQYIAIKKSEIINKFSNEIYLILFTLNADLLNNTKQSEVDILFYNRVPKSGSLQLIRLMQQLGKLHDYTVAVDPNDGGIKTSLSKQQEKNTIDDILNFGEGIAFVSHMNYINFSVYNKPQPIYINMVRDPVERVISWYYYIRSPWIFVPLRKKNNKKMPNPLWVNMEFDECVLKKDKACTYLAGNDYEKVNDHRRQTLFFCGNNRKLCMPFNTKFPLELAKRVVEKYYAVVGCWEDTNVTLTVLENYVPRYFKGATKMYYNGLSKNIANSNPFKPNISEKVKQMVRQNFTQEMEFYQFCRQRLHKQYLALRTNDLKLLALKSLNAYRLNNTRKADIEVLFFNRCAKVGSEALFELLSFLETFNDNLNLERAGLLASVKGQMSTVKQRQFAEKISALDEGSIWIEHINWIDFEEFNLPKPIYINMVRDPVDRVISWYFYERGAYKNAIEYKKYPDKPTKAASWYKKDFNNCVRNGDPECQYVPFSVKNYVGNFKRQSLFFCGFDLDCMPFNSPTAIQIAKEHVERDYAVVGTWEETNITLTVFENYIPRFFNGAKLLFELNIDKITNRNKNRRKPKIDADVKEMMRKNFTYEYEFYYFCKQRLYKQYLAINLKNLEDHKKLD